MTHAIRWLTAILAALSKLIPASRREWIEAVVAESASLRADPEGQSASLPAGPSRVAWLLGAFPVLFREVVRLRTFHLGLAVGVAIAIAFVLRGAGLVVVAVVGAGWLLVSRARTGHWPWAANDPHSTDRAWSVRVFVLVAVAAVAVLRLVVSARYPQVEQGGGTPLYLTLLIVLLTAYVLGTFALSRVDGRIVRYGVLAGFAAAVLWTAGLPAGGRYHVSGALAVLYSGALIAAFTGPAVIGAVAMTRRGGIERGILTGAAAGMYAALTNLIGGLILVLVLPERVPMDTNVLARHRTAADILGANVGEDLVLYVGLLLAWPVAAALLGAIAGALTTARRTVEL